MWRNVFPDVEAVQNIWLLHHGGICIRVISLLVKSSSFWEMFSMVFKNRNFAINSAAVMSIQRKSAEIVLQDFIAAEVVQPIPISSTG